jgi:hypothetical protein
MDAEPEHGNQSDQSWLQMQGLVRTAAVRVPISSLRDADSPRLSGEDAAHIRVLVESGADLPPIIVQRETMRVIDGMHRVRAMQLRGDNEISVLFFDGDDAAAFVLAVRNNIAHGLPLTLADRRAAAVRIIDSYPYLSDRAIAAVSGLSPKTVAGLRPDRDPAIGALVTRIGQDGRVRPVNYIEARRQAHELLSSRPDASLDDVARIAGVSRRTARDVQQRLNQGIPVVPEPRGSTRHVGTRRRRSPKDPSDIIGHLRSDPSLRLTESGRALIRLLNIHAMWSQDSGRLVERLPAHCVGMIADVALACANTWRDFAERLASRQRDLMSEAKDGPAQPRDAG